MNIQTLLRVLMVAVVATSILGARAPAVAAPQTCDVKLVTEHLSGKPARLKLGGSGTQHAWVAIEKQGPFVSFIIPPLREGDTSGIVYGYGKIWQEAKKNACREYPWVTDAKRLAPKWFDDGYSGVIVNMKVAPHVVSFVDGGDVEKESVTALLRSFNNAKEREHPLLHFPLVWEDGREILSVAATDHSGRIEPVTPASDGESGEPPQGGGDTPARDCRVQDVRQDFDPQDGDWAIPNDGPVIVEFWSNRTSNTALRKVWLGPGGATVPGSGKAYLYPAGCEDPAWNEYLANPLPAISFDEIWAEANAGTPGQEPGPDCTAQAVSAGSTPGVWWNFSSGGPIVVNFWSNWTEDNTTYKFLLEPGSYSMPGGGDASLFPAGCEDAAGAAFDANPNPAGDWGYIMSFAIQPEPEPEPINCTATPISHDVSRGPWSFSNGGPIILNHYARAGEQEYKNLLAPGSYTVEGGGTAYLYPSGCEDVARAEFTANPLPAGGLTNM